MVEFSEVLSFWFEQIEPAQWWTKDPQFDRMIAERFGIVHAQACSCELYHWRSSADGRLAEIVVLDQFSRNIYRGKPQSFASDPLALGLAQAAVELGADQALESDRRSFLYMPYMHSESAVIHRLAVALFGSLADESVLGFELKHQAIIERFGRYPHRNTILNRQSTAEELAFLEQPNSSF